MSKLKAKLKKPKRKKKYRKRIKALLILTFLILLLLFLFIKRNEVTKYLLENQISALTDSKISLESITINKKGIYLNNLNVESQGELYYYLETEELNVDIDYSALFKRKEWLSEVIDSLYINTPTIKYKQKFLSDEDNQETEVREELSSKSESAFDIRKYLRKVTIENASLEAEVVYHEYFGIRDNFSGAQITFDNKREESLIAEMLDNSHKEFNVGLQLDDSGLKAISLETAGYNPDSLFVPVAKDISLDLAGKAKLDFNGPEGLYLALDFNNKEASAKLYSMDLVLEDLKIKGDSKNLVVKPSKVKFMQIPLAVEGSLINLFHRLEIEAQAKLKDYQINNTYAFMQGIVDANVDVSGYASDLLIKGQVKSDSLDFNSLTFTNIDASLDYYDQLKLDLHSTELDQNIISGSGRLDKNFISANLQIKNKEESMITLQGDLLTKGIVIEGDSYFRLDVTDFTIGYDDVLLPAISGMVKLDKDILTGELLNESLKLTIETDLAFEHSQASIEFLDFHANTAYTALQKDELANINPLINGLIKLSKDKKEIIAGLNLEITAIEDKIFLPLKTNLIWDLEQNDIKISNTIFEGKVFDNQTTIYANVFMSQLEKLNAEIIINNDIIIKGNDILTDNRALKIEVNQVSSSEIKSFFPAELVTAIPDAFISFNADYLWNDNLIKGDLNITGIQVAGFSGYAFKSSFKGIAENININELLLYNERQILLSATGAIITTDGFQANVDAVINEIDFKDYQNIFPLEGYVNAGMTFRYDSRDQEKYSIRLKGVGSDFKVADFEINDIYYNLLYSPQKIHVDNLYLNANNFADLNIIGDFSYDILKNEFLPSTDKLYVNLDADVYNLINKLAPNLLEEGKFDLASEMIVGIDEEGLQVFEGYLKTEDSYLKIINQPELLDDIDITATILDNKLDLERFNLNLGDGFITIANEILDDNDNFFIGGLILGQFKLYTSQRGILANIPEYMPKNESALIKIAGLSNDFATIKGPFDDMKIDLEVNVSNASIIYPPNTENLLSIISSASQNTFAKNEKSEENESQSTNPLPFVLDARLVVGENLKYVTYPTDILVTPNSYLNLTYNNSEWSVPDARFLAEEGTVTFLDTDFEVDLVEILINEIDFSVNGTFVKKVEDGSTVTLQISNGQSNQLGLNDLNLTLTSDNPNDKTQAQVINRLRVSDSSYDVVQTDQNALQNETILMLGSNVDNTFINSFLRPVETFFRRRLLLDYFYIRPGFVKNMVSNYVINDQTNNPNLDQSQELSDSELAQFSSSILLNNLTIDFGRPLYKRLYFNYQGFFQEITDLNRRSKIIYDQDFQLRTNINFKTKMTYTFKYRPSGENSHEIMLFHSINF